MPIIYSGKIPFAQAGAARAAQYAMLVPEAQAEAWRRAYESAKAEAENENAVKQKMLEEIDKRIEALNAAMDARVKGTKDYNQMLVDLWETQVKAGTKTVSSSETRGYGGFGGGFGFGGRSGDDFRIDARTKKAVEEYKGLATSKLGQVVPDIEQHIRINLDAVHESEPLGRVPGDVTPLAARMVEDSFQLAKADIEANPQKYGDPADIDEAAWELVMKVANEDPKRQRAFELGAGALMASQQGLPGAGGGAGGGPYYRHSVKVTKKVPPDIPPPELEKLDTSDIENQIAALLAKREKIGAARQPNLEDVAGVLRRYYGKTSLARTKPETYKDRVFQEAMKLDLRQVRQLDKPPEERQVENWVREIDRMVEEGAKPAEVWQEIPKIPDVDIDKARAYAIARMREHAAKP